MKTFIWLITIALALLSLGLWDLAERVVQSWSGVLRGFFADDPVVAQVSFSRATSLDHLCCGNQQTSERERSVGAHLCGNRMRCCGPCRLCRSIWSHITGH